MYKSVPWNQVRQYWIVCWVCHVIFFLVDGLTIQLGRQGGLRELSAWLAIRWIDGDASIRYVGSTHVTVYGVETAEEDCLGDCLGCIRGSIARARYLHFPVWKTSAVPAPVALTFFIQCPGGHGLNDAVPGGICDMVSQNMCSCCHNGHKLTFQISHCIMTISHAQLHCSLRLVLQLVFRLVT